MEDISIIKLDELKLMYVEAETFPEGIKDSWDKLEKALGTTKGRKFYGISKCIGSKIIYRACVIPIDDNEPDQLGLETLTIPSSRYASKKLLNWSSQIQMFGTIFDELFSKHSTNGELYALEDYKSPDEVILMVPLI